jgi:uncharacterized membrane protein YphA (DoxX/SURF4 family)
MFVALVITTVALSLIAVASAAMKLRKAEQVVTAIHGAVGVPMRFLPVLAALEIAGAVGILLGLAVEPLGIAAATGLVLYFVGAVAGHLRVRDLEGAGQPVLPLLLSITVLVLRTTTA